MKKKTTYEIAGSQTGGLTFRLCDLGGMKKGMTIQTLQRYGVK